MVKIEIPEQPIYASVKEASRWFNEQKLEVVNTLRMMTPWELVQVHATIIAELHRREMARVWVIDEKKRS